MPDSPSSTSSGASGKAQRCFKCGVQRKLHRMLCLNCYDLWLRQRPIGVGACCVSCGDRRRAHLRFFELARGFVVLCHNCAAAAEALRPLPRSEEGLRERLARERRSGERRQAAGLGAPARTALPPGGRERRQRIERRVGARDLFDATDLVVEEVDESAGEASGQAAGDVTQVARIDFLQAPRQGLALPDDDMTNIHRRI